LEYVCGKYADKPSIVYMRNDGGKTEFTFGGIFERLQKAKKTFERAGLRPGDRAAIIAPHSPFVVLAGLSLAYANVTGVLIDAALPPEEINRLLDFSDVRVVFTIPKIQEALDKALITDIPVFDLSREGDEYSLFGGAAATVTRPETIDRDTDVIAMLFSSGTTASAKGVMITYTAVRASRPMYHELTNSTDNINLLFALPFNHVAGYFCGFQHFLSGCGLGIIEDMDVSKLQAGFHEYQPEFFALVPKFYEMVEQKIRQEVHSKGAVTERIFYAMLALSGFLRKNFGINIGKTLFKGVRNQVFGERLYGLGAGASLCKKSTTKFFLNLGIGIWANFYALTETFVPAVVTGIFDRYPAGTEGRVDRFDGIEVKIQDSDESGVGEIRVKSILMMKGYFREPELTAAAIDTDGYFKTGDLGYIDAKKYLHVTGRMKEAIHMRTGKKVAPLDVDHLYGELCPGVELASCGVPSEADGAFDEIHIFVESGGMTADGQEEIRRSVTAFSSRTSSLYKISGVHFIDKLPVTSVGKVKRYQLKEAALTERAETSLNAKMDAPQRMERDTESVLLNLLAGFAEGQAVTPDSSLKYDLGFDSLTLLELCVALEEAFQMAVADDMGGAETVRDLITLINNGGGKRGAVYNIEDYPLPKKRRHRAAFRLFMGLSRLVWKFDVSGLENIPAGGRYILCPNHQSYLDSLWIWTAMRRRVDLRKICCLAAEVFLPAKFMLSMLGGIPVERQGNTIPAMKRGLDCIQDGYTMLIHPEGTRTRDGAMHEFKGGAAKLAIDAGAALVPVRIDGAWDIFPPGKKLPKICRLGKRHSLKISFGKPLAPEGKSVEELTALLQSEVARLGAEGADFGTSCPSCPEIGANTKSRKDR
jgi:long-chain acyl-CoA synthetase